jgi:hypothetical protein
MECHRETGSLFSEEAFLEVRCCYGFYPEDIFMVLERTKLKLEKNYQWMVKIRIKHDSLAGE